MFSAQRLERAKASGKRMVETAMTITEVTLAEERSRSRVTWQHKSTEQPSSRPWMRTNTHNSNQSLVQKGKYYDQFERTSKPPGVKSSESKTVEEEIDLGEPERVTFLEAELTRQGVERLNLVESDDDEVDDKEFDEYNEKFEDEDQDYGDDDDDFEKEGDQGLNNDPNAKGEDIDIVKSHVPGETKPIEKVMIEHDMPM